MVLRFSPGTISSQTLRRAASFQKSVSKAGSMAPARVLGWTEIGLYSRIGAHGVLDRPQRDRAGAGASRLARLLCAGRDRLGDADRADVCGSVGRRQLFRGEERGRPA